MQTAPSGVDIRYEPTDQPPVPLSAGLGIQMAVLTLGGIVLTPAIIIRSAGGTPEFLAWAVAAALVVSGISTILQALGKFRIGAGYVLLMGTSGAFIAICIEALRSGGPALMCTLIVMAALFQLLFAAHLSKFRRILTPAVSGTVIMLIAVTVMPILFDMLNDVPETAPASAAPVTALITVVTIAAIALRGTGLLRLWAPIIGVAFGTVTSLFYNIYDTQALADASWLGFPTTGWPGLSFSLDTTFWTLLPAFIFVTMIGAIETIGDSIAVQRVSWRRPRAVDFRAVQGALSADGVGNLLSGLAGTIPNTTYSSSISMIELTGVAARRVGIALGITFLVVAFQPKILAVFLAIPGPVVAGFVIVLIAMLFVVGMRIVVQDGIDYRTSLIVGFAFWIGAGLQQGVIFPEVIGGFAGGILDSGMVGGGLVAILLTTLVAITKGRRHHLQTPFALTALGEIQEFIEKTATRYKWRPNDILRAQAAAEEALLILSAEQSRVDERELKYLDLIIAQEEDGLSLEFVASDTQENIEDKIALLGRELSESSLEKDISLRMLRHLTSSVRHERYHNTEIVLLKVAQTVPA
ncbi:MAG: hypothetical protein OXI38_01040 [Bacteroidota bacterium]|nr:hypothetical protein [Bacteroidota bacterium]